MKRKKYNDEVIIELVKKHGGLLVKQLYDALPESERPSQNYFIEYLRKIPGINVVNYNERENSLFVTQSNGMRINKKRLLIMAKAIEDEEGFDFPWFINMNQIPYLYNALIN